MTVRAKFYCNGINPSFEDQPEAVSRQVTFGAVCRGAANKEWASATPAGSLTMTVRNDLATAQFQYGKEYYLTFEEAEPAPTAGDGHEAKPGMSLWNTMVCETCGMSGSWVKKEGSAYEHEGRWDDEAQKRHDEAYGAPVKG